MMMNKTVISVPSVKIRYYAYNCLEIKLPSKKTIMIDPCIKKDGLYGCGCSADTAEGCDYVLINHAHFDHTLSLGELYNRFHPLVMAHEATVMELAEYFDIPYMKMVPFTDGCEYNYDDFKVRILRARHNPDKMFMIRPSGLIDETANDNFRKHTDPLNDKEKRIEYLGSVFNNNFLITLPDNLRIGLFAGNPGMIEPEDANTWKDLHPDILFAHRAPVHYENWAERMANNLAVTGARLMIPIHIDDNFFTTISAEEYIGSINEICESKGIPGRAVFMDRARWYEFSTAVSMI